MVENQPTSDIRSLTRTHPGMFFGWTTERGVVHIVNELVSNGIDLFLHGRATRLAVGMDGDMINYSDDGPGLPYDVPGPGNVSLAEHYLTSYHTTPTADDHAPHIHMLSHGLGLMCVNAVCEQFTVKTWRSGSLWEQHLARGLPLDSPRIIDQGEGKGTRISFHLDSAVFQAKLPCRRTLRRLLFEAAHLFPGITLALEQEVFHAPDGLADLASLYYLQAATNDWHEPAPFALHTHCYGVEVNVGAIGAIGESTTEPLLRSWANGSITRLGGTHVAGLRDALRSVHWTPAVAMIHVIMHKPEFAGPTRGNLANVHVRKIVRDCVKPVLKQWWNDRPSNG
jgi:DNA gyrase subunit B